MIDRPAGAYVETASGLAPDMKDEAMAEKVTGQGSEARGHGENIEKVSKPKKKEVTTNA